MKSPTVLNSTLISNVDYIALAFSMARAGFEPATADLARNYGPIRVEGEGKKENVGETFVRGTL